MIKTIRKSWLAAAVAFCAVFAILALGFAVKTQAAETSPLTSINFTRTRTDSDNSFKYLEIVYNLNEAISGSAMDVDVLVNGETAKASLSFDSANSRATFTISDPKGWSQSTAASFYVTIPAGTSFGDGNTLAEDSSWTIVQGAAMAASGNWIIGSCTGKAAADAGTTSITGFSSTKRTIIVSDRNRLDIQFTMDKSITNSQTITTDVIVNGEPAKGELTVSDNVATIYIISPKGWSQSSATAFYVEIPETLVFHDGSYLASKTVCTLVQTAAMAQSGNYVQAACTGTMISDAAATELGTVSFTRTRTSLDGTTKYLELVLNVDRTLSGNAVNAYIKVNGGEELASLSVTGTTATFTLTNPTFWTDDSCAVNGSVFYVTIPANTVFGDGGYLAEETCYTITQTSNLTSNGSWYIGSCSGVKVSAPTIESFIWNGTAVEGETVNAVEGDLASLLTATPAGATVTWSDGAVDNDGKLIAGYHTATATYTDIFGRTVTEDIAVLVTGDIEISSFRSGRAIYVNKTTPRLDMYFYLNRELTNIAKGTVVAENVDILINGTTHKVSLTYHNDDGYYLEIIVQNPTGWTPTEGDDDYASDPEVIFNVLIPSGTMLADTYEIASEAAYKITKTVGLEAYSAHMQKSFDAETDAEEVAVPEIGFTWNGTPVTEVDATAGDSKNLLAATPAGAIITWSDGAVDENGNLVTGNHTATATYTDGFNRVVTDTIAVKVIGMVNITGFRWGRAIYLNKTTPQLDINLYLSGTNADYDLTASSSASIGKITVSVNGTEYQVDVYYLLDGDNPYIQFSIQNPTGWTPTEGGDDYATDPAVNFYVLLSAGTSISSNYKLESDAAYVIVKSEGLTQNDTHPRKECTGTAVAFSWNGTAATEVNAVEGDLVSLLTATPAGATITWSDGAVDTDGKLTAGTHTATASYGGMNMASITVTVAEKSYTTITDCTWIGHNSTSNLVYITVATTAENKHTYATTSATVIVGGEKKTATIYANYAASNETARWIFYIEATPDTSYGAKVDITIPAGIVFPDGTVLKYEVRYIGTNNDAEASQGNYSIQLIEKPTITLEWTGASLSAGADANQLVATLTGNTVQDGDTATITWSDGAVVDDKLQEGTWTVTATYTDSYNQTVTETIEVKVIFGVESFVMQSGAYIRADGNGMKFEAYLSEADYNYLIAQGAKFGMVIIPRDYIVSGYELTVENLFTNPKYSVDGDSSNDIKKMLLLEDIKNGELKDGNFVYYGGIYDIITTNITREFVGLAFIEVDGDYALAAFANDDIDNNSRSMYYVAQRAIDANAENADKAQANYIDVLANYAAQINKTYYVSYTVRYVYQNYGTIKIVEETKKAPVNTEITVTADAKYTDGGTQLLIVSDTSITKKLYVNKENVFEFVYKQSEFAGIDVSAWVMSPLNGADDAGIAQVADELKAAGITTANLIWAGAYANTENGIERFKVLIEGLYSKGIESVVCFHNSGATESEVYTSIPDFSECDGFVGVLVWDEPTLAMMDRVAEYATMFEAVYAGTDAIFMVNLLPSYATEDSIGSDYRVYLETFCQTVLSKVSGTKWLSVDTYPIMSDGTLAETFLYDIAMLKVYAESYGAHAHVALQSSGWNEGNTKKATAPTEAQMNFQVYTALAMGVDSYSWFSYGPVNAENLAGQSPSESETIYNSLKNTNAEIAMFGDLYKTYDWKGAVINQGSYYFWNGAAYNEQGDIGDAKNESVFSKYNLTASSTVFSSISSSQNFVMGVLENTDGKDAYVISNYSSAKANKTATITLKTDSAKTFVIYTNGNAETVTINGTYTLTLAVGEGAFIVEE